MDDKERFNRDLKRGYTMRRCMVKGLLTPDGDPTCQNTNEDCVFMDMYSDACAYGDTIIELKEDDCGFLNPHKDCPIWRK